MVNLVNCSSRVSAVSWLTMIFMTVFVLLAHQVSLGQSAAAPNGQYLDEENINQNKQLVLGEFSHSHLFLNTFDRIRNKNGTRYAALGAFLIRKRDPMMMTAVCLPFSSVDRIGTGNWTGGFAVDELPLKWDRPNQQIPPSSFSPFS